MLPWQAFNFFYSTTPAAKPDVAISACLNGEAVRYDGSAKVLETTSTLLSRYLTLLPICPEVGAGLSVPRPPIQLVQSDRGIEALGRDNDKLNVTEALHGYRRQSLSQLRDQLCGYIFKSRSPSCGLGSTPVFNQQGQQIGIGSGLQADYFQQQLPWLVFADETRLQSDQQCQQFIMRCLLALDLQLGIRQAGLAAVHQHYRFLIDTLAKETRERLQQSLATDATDRYRTLLVTEFAQQDFT